MSIHRLSGAEVKRLMRVHGMTIAALSFVMGITQKRIREIRDSGIEGGNVVRDWQEAITGVDPGPLPERYRISGRQEEGDCCYCGAPLFNGETAYEYASSMFCSVNCSRQFFHYRKERTA